MRAHFLQHVPFEGLGSIEGWLKKSAYRITSTKFFEDTELPNTNDIDLLIVMGGPMSVNDEAVLGWLKREKQFIKNFIDTGKPVLGVCLGAQLIASALGSAVLPNPLKEIGWLPVRSVNKSPEAFPFPEQLEVFHWHGETFELPPSAIRLAESSGCKNQAFQISKQVIGLQFHLETTAGTAQAIVENCRDELVEGEYVQTETEILSVSEQRYQSINKLMEDILDYLHQHS